MTTEEKIARKEQNQKILDEWKEEKAALKQAKKEKRALRKARMKARPVGQKILSGLGKTLAVVLPIILILALNVKPLISAFQDWAGGYADKLGYTEKNTEAEREYVPADEEAQARIAAMTGYDKDDTWTFYFYVIGSNLESSKQNDLSGMVNMITKQQKNANSAASNQQALSDIFTYTDAIEAAGLELPTPMYYINAPKAASSVPVTDDVIVSDSYGCASQDIDEILSVKLQENVKFVIETGGATHWSNPRINPNRTQTFVYSSEGFEEVRNEPVHDMAAADSLSDFLTYCNDNYKADHNVLFLWDHGGGAFGYGIDEIYGTMMSLKDIHEALDTVYTANTSDPAFELIGFDACLMASAEVMDALDGYGRYFVGSEETEPGYGWYYTDWLGQFVENTGMNGAQLGLAIADSYMDFYARIDTASALPFPFGLVNDCTFSVLDIHKGAEVYDAYVELLYSVLAQSTDSARVLTDVSQAARAAIHYGAKNADCLNTLDIGTFMDSMPSSLAKETEAVQKALEEAVLYVRSGSSLEGSRGITVFFPDQAVENYSIKYIMDYVNNICEDEAVSALYFYKIAGCLTEEMQAYLEENELGELKTLDLTALQKVEEEPLVMNEAGGFSAKVSEEARNSMINIGLAVGKENESTITYYGVSADAELNSAGELTTTFEGKWLTIDGQPMSVEVAFDSEETITYHCPVQIGLSDATMVISYDKSTGEFMLIGAYKESDEIAGDFFGRNIPDMNVGDSFQPAYRVTDSKTLQSSTEYGSSIRYDKNMKISMEPLPDATYLSTITFNSIRGDEFNTGSVTFTMNNGKVTNMEPAVGYEVVNNG